MNNRGNVGIINLVEKCFIDEGSVKDLCVESLFWSDKLMMWKSVLNRVFLMIHSYVRQIGAS